MVPPKDSKIVAPVIKRLTPSEAQERMEKGLCYDCDERFTCHRCKTQKLFWVEGLLHQEDEDDGHSLENSFLRSVAGMMKICLLKYRHMRLLAPGHHKPLEYQVP